MKRVLILGAGGMLGHKLCHSYRQRFDTWATVRGNLRSYERYDLLPQGHLIGGVDAFNFQTVIEAMAAVKPDVVINGIGIIKQLRSAKNPIVSLTINALFPHQLANLCQASGARLIHLSTDCVFTGRKGMYTEDEVSDAEDLYGRTKYLGEVDAENCLTLRTSIIGRELTSTHGLVEWFLSNQGGQVKGFKEAIFSGFTTMALADIIAGVIEHQPELAGVWQVSAEPISKYDLLVLIRDAFGADIRIEPDAKVVIDRSLDSTRFRQRTGFQPMDWQQMIQQMADDPTPYEEWRNYVA